MLPPSDTVEDDDEDEERDEDDKNIKTGTVYRVGPKGKVRALPGGVNDVS